MKTASKVGLVIFYILVVLTFINEPHMVMFIGLCFVVLPLLPVTVYLWKKEE